jgi:hypothetical protein
MEVQEKQLKWEPITFVETSQPMIIERSIFWIFTWREAHLSIKNTDNVSGTFTINYVFDKGIEKPTVTKIIELEPGEQQDVSVCVPLSVMKLMEVNVIPQNKPVFQKVLVKKDVSPWSLIWSAICHTQIQ